ncbi:hypothetical protein UFOVP424_7 [uncultured Caudovirales phage]|uniref:Uncharacterized protein n=1 Tax=uncultured Caudovirales phage TaxID=2100421 RepID=A0A6J5M4R1_9CAUD|nr:hypothetical protein UFOVP424_7 [uncultured Caudovirales phage]
MFSKGISWIDDCRIPFVEDINFDYRTTRIKEQTIYGGGKGIPKLNGNPEYNNQGRFPANILVSDDMLNDGSTSKTNNGKRHNKTTQMFYGKGEHYYTGDAGTNSRYYDIDKWFDKIINYE